MAIEAAKEQLKEAAQILNPEYSELTEDQKKVAEKTVGEEMQAFGKPAEGSKAWKQAVAIGLSKARKE
jgi:hypothetical protein